MDVELINRQTEVVIKVCYSLWKIY